MDIGFEGGFRCLKRSVNASIHPNWICRDEGEFVTLAKTGFETVFANDIRKDAKLAWETYFQSRGRDVGGIYRLESIVDLVKRHRSGEFRFPDGVDVVTGGFPCQDFSVAGKRLGFNSRKSHDGGKLQVDEPSVESRGQLYMWMREVVSIVQPRLFVAENVKGLTNLADAKDVIERDFSDAANGGYMVIPARVLHSADYGVPQSRERVIFFGFRKNALTKRALDALEMENIPSSFDPYPPRTHAYTAEGEGLMPPVTCAEAFYGLAEPERSDDDSQKAYSKAKFMGDHCQGQAEIRLNSIGPTIRSEHHGNIEYRRLSSEHGGKHSAELANGMSERRLTLRECARIQTFPDEYQFILKQNVTRGGDCPRAIPTRSSAMRSPAF